MKMRKRTILGVPVAAAIAGGLALSFLGGASAQQPDATRFTANLAPVPLNGAQASGTYNISLNGSQATITGQISGLAATFMGDPYPHVQHIHGGANGVCPIATADANSDGVINVMEGAPSYGGILTTLSTSGDTSPAAGTNVQTAPSGATVNYNRTITLDQATLTALRNGNAVIVVHGLDPATAAPAAGNSPSELVPSLPLAATAPALCGTLTAASAPAPTPTTMAPAASPTPASGGQTMRPPSTGDGGLASSGDAWSLPAMAAALALVGFGSAAGVALIRSRSR
jgi:hypothetical protein